MNEDWIANTIGSTFFFIIILSISIEWDVVFKWFGWE